MYSLGAAGVGEQGGNWDSPGQGEPQGVQVIYYALLGGPSREVIVSQSKCGCQYCQRVWFGLEDSPGTHPTAYSPPNAV
jgi:hypothetical protein